MTNDSADKLSLTYFARIGHFPDRGTDPNYQKLI